MTRLGAIAAIAALALCAAPAEAKKGKKPKPLGPVVTVTVIGPVPAPSDLGSTVTATCPAGTQVFGGGFSAPFGETAGMLVHESHRSGPRSWTVTAHNINGPVPITVEAYCRRAKKRSIATFVATETLTGAGEVRQPTAACPSGRTLVGGGFTSTVGPGGDDLILIQTSNPRNSVWEVSGYNVDPNPLSLTAEAYCMGPGTKTKLPVGIQSGPASQLTPVSATSAACPKPKKKKGGKKTKQTRMSAGGFIVPMGPPGGPIPFVTESRMTSQGWLTTASPASNAPGTLSVTSRGVCA